MSKHQNLTFSSKPLQKYEAQLVDSTLLASLTSAGVVSGFDLRAMNAARDSDTLFTKRLGTPHYDLNLRPLTAAMSVYNLDFHRCTPEDVPDGIVRFRARALHDGQALALSNHFELFLDRERSIRISSDAPEVPRWVHWGPRMQLLEDWDVGGIFAARSNDPAETLVGRLPKMIEVQAGDYLEVTISFGGHHGQYGGMQARARRIAPPQADILASMLGSPRSQGVRVDADGSATLARDMRKQIATVCSEPLTLEVSMDAGHVERFVSSGPRWVVEAAAKTFAEAHSMGDMTYEGRRVNAGQALVQGAAQIRAALPGVAALCEAVGLDGGNRGVRYDECGGWIEAQCGWLEHNVVEDAVVRDGSGKGETPAPLGSLFQWTGGGPGGERPGFDNGVIKVDGPVASW
jgi:hypothetical protein